MLAVDSNASQSLGSDQILREGIESLCSDFALRLSAEEVAAAMRKIPDGDREAAVLTVLVGALPAFCRRGVLLPRTGGRTIALRSLGPDQRPGLREGEQLCFELAATRAIESNSALTATGAQGDIPPRLSTELAYVDEDDVRVFPMLLRNTVIGALLADGPPIQDSAIETLDLGAEASIEVLGARPGLRADRATNLG